MSCVSSTCPQHARVHAHAPVAHPRRSCESNRHGTVCDRKCTGPCRPGSGKGRVPGGRDSAREAGPGRGGVLHGDGGLLAQPQSCLGWACRGGWNVRGPRDCAELCFRGVSHCQQASSVSSGPCVKGRPMRLRGGEAGDSRAESRAEGRADPQPAGQAAGGGGVLWGHPRSREQPCQGLVLLDSRTAFE